MKNYIITVLKDTTESEKKNLTTFISVGTQDELGFVSTMGTGFIKSTKKFVAGQQLRKKAESVVFEESEIELKTTDGEDFHPRWVIFDESGKEGE